MGIFSFGENAINRFSKTAVGKSIQTLLWTVAAYGITIGGAALAKVHWSDQMLALGVPGLINLLLYTIKVFTDKEVPNFPNSTPMQLVPVNTTVTETTVVKPTPTQIPVISK